MANLAGAHFVFQGRRNCSDGRLCWAIPNLPQTGENLDRWQTKANTSSTLEVAAGWTQITAPIKAKVGRQWLLGRLGKGKLSNRIICRWISAKSTRQTVQRAQGKCDDSALNGIQLYCRTPGGMDAVVAPKQGRKGQWTKFAKCKRALHQELRLRVEGNKRAVMTPQPMMSIHMYEW